MTALAEKPVFRYQNTLSMKTLLLLFCLLLTGIANAQITTPVVRAGVGVDADLRASFVNGAQQAGSDDWFFGTNGTDHHIIDTTGAVAMLAAYAADVSPFPTRMSTFFRPMSVPQFSVINNRLWLDALFVRDYHGTDSTVFTAGSDKNGMSPAQWTGGIQNIPDKNDILDMFMHVRREGPDRTDSLWFFGGLSLDNSTGNRYFDFEMYQTDIYYDRPSKKWFGYGPHDGHTRWEFDGNGNIRKPGDIIFSAEYQSSSLTMIEARIWVHKEDLELNPASFNWSGKFDGASSGSMYGYASILPKNGGTFYTGLQSVNGTWAGPFALVLQDNSVVTNYGAKQFMEFSVNLTRLGLDPASVFGSDICGTPFNRVVVKTRASASFTAELKDFVAPIDLFLAPRVDAIADVPMFCGVAGVSSVFVRNPSTASVYTWYTLNGHIVGTTTGTSIQVDAPGTYIVQQQLAVGCNPYAFDTVQIVFDAGCVPMDVSQINFTAQLKNRKGHLQWSVPAENTVAYYMPERSTDGKSFTAIARMDAGAPTGNPTSYQYTDDLAQTQATQVWYRIRIAGRNGSVSYTNPVKLILAGDGDRIRIFPNPADQEISLSAFAASNQQMELRVLDFSGALIQLRTFSMKQGENLFTLDTRALKAGAYILQVKTASGVHHQKILVSRR